MSIRYSDGRVSRTTHSDVQHNLENQLSKCSHRWVSLQSRFARNPSEYKNEWPEIKSERRVYPSNTVFPSGQNFIMVDVYYDDGFQKIGVEVKTRLSDLRVSGSRQLEDMRSAGLLVVLAVSEYVFLKEDFEQYDFDILLSYSLSRSGVDDWYLQSGDCPPVLRDAVRPWE